MATRSLLLTWNEVTSAWTDTSDRETDSDADAIAALLVTRLLKGAAHQIKMNELVIDV